MIYSWEIFFVLIAINIAIWLLISIHLDEKWVEIEKLSDYKKRNLK